MSADPDPEIKPNFREEFNDPVNVSLVAQWAYCPRRAALIDVEAEFAENVHTMRSREIHEQVDLPMSEFADSVRLERALPIWSERYGLLGKADLIEFHPDGRIVPVEFKPGRKRPRLAEDLQVATQAVCLEEMFGRPVPFGAVYHHKSHRRREVEISDDLRWLLESALREIRAVRISRILPRAPADDRCNGCSMPSICRPEITGEAGLRRIAEQVSSLFVFEEPFAAINCD